MIAEGRSNSKLRAHRPERSRGASRPHHASEFNQHAINTLSDLRGKKI